MSLLREIQNDVASPGGDVVSVLRKCKILAARLGSVEFARWIELELNGYPESQPIPDYRRLSTVCYANFLNVAWKADRQAVPLGLFSPAAIETIYQIEFRDGIAKAATFITSGARVNRPDLIGAIQGQMYPQMECTGAWIEISGANFEQIDGASFEQPSHLDGNRKLKWNTRADDPKLFE